MKTKLKSQIISVLICIYSFTLAPAYAEKMYLTPSVDMHFSSWEGENASSPNMYKSDTTALAVGLMLQQSKWYGGVSIKGSRFEFLTIAPEQDDATQPLPGNIERGEFDLVAGYYFWKQVSLFADIKSSSMGWSNSNYSVKNGGLGLGVSGYYPTEQGSFYASFGVIRLSTTSAGQDVGDGTGSSIEFGFLNKLSSTLTLRVGIKSQTQVIDYDIAGEQVNRIGSLVLGISKVFSL